MRRSRSGVFFVGLVLATACRPEPVRPRAYTDTAASEQDATRSLRAAYIATRQEEGRRDRTFHVRAEHDVLASTLPGLGVTFAPAGVRVREEEGAWTMSMRTTALTCDGRARSFARVRPSTSNDAPHRVSYDRGAFTEWYVSGPLGLEQGYTVPSNPCRAGETIAVDVALSGLTPTVEADGSLALRDREGVVRLAYGELFATDASGRAIDATLSLDGATARLAIDPRGARFPIVIDPLVAAPEATFLPVGTGDGGPYHKFGSAVAIDGDTAVIGVPDFSGNHHAYQGAVYVYTRSGTTWTREARIDSPDLSHEAFGFVVAISGDSIAIGAPETTHSGTAGPGSAYVFTRTAGTWTQQARVMRPSGAAMEEFATAIDIDGDTLAVGAPYDQGIYGAVYVYVRDGAAWSIEGRVEDTSNGQDGRFGTAVAVYGDRMAIGSPTCDVGADLDRGAVNVFKRASGVWTSEQHLLAMDGTQDDTFGASVDLDDANLLVGAPRKDVASFADQGVAYVFTRTGTVWSQQQRLEAGAGGSSSDEFGRSVSLSGDVAVIGSPKDDTGGVIDRGAAIVFTRAGSTWTRTVKKFASNGAGGETMGTAVAIDGATVLAGVPAWKNGALENQGEAFTYLGPVYGEQGRLWAGTAPGNFQLGAAVDISGDTAVVSAFGDGTGAAYVFVRGTDGAWTLQQKLVDADGVAGQLFGLSVALDGDMVAISAPFATGNNIPYAGVVVIFRRTGTVWALDSRLGGFVGSEFFGYSVALDGADLAIGAPWASHAGLSHAGKVYFFRRFGTDWDYLDGIPSTQPFANVEYGKSISIASGVAAIGSSTDLVDTVKTGAVYVMTYDSGTNGWVHKARLVHTGALAGDELGTDVAVLAEDGATAIYAGIPNRDGKGAVVRFTGADATWTERETITPSTRTMDADFGTSVEVSDRLLVVGAPTFGGNAGAGLWLFSHPPAGGWIEQRKIASAPSSNAVALDGLRVLVGQSDAPGDSVEEGRALLYRVSGFASDACANETECVDGLSCTNGVCCSGDACIAPVADGGMEDDGGVNGTRPYPKTGLCAASIDRDAPRSALLVVLVCLGALLVRRRLARVIVLAFALAMPLTTAHAQTAPPAESAESVARAQFQLGQALYNEGRFLESAQAFEAAYAASPRAQLLYNAYLSYQNTQDLDRAASALRRYIEADPANDTPSFRSRLAAIESQIAARDAARAREAELAAADAAEQQAAVEAQTATAAPTSSGRGRRIAGIALIGGGGAIAVTGFLVGGLRLSSDADRLDGHCGASAGLPEGTCADDDVVNDVASHTTGMRALAWGSLGLGVTAAAVGTVLLLTGGDDGAHAALPTLSCGRTGCIAGAVVGF